MSWRRTVEAVVGRPLHKQHTSLGASTAGEALKQALLHGHSVLVPVLVPVGCPGCNNKSYS